MSVISDLFLAGFWPQPEERDSRLPGCLGAWGGERASERAVGHCRLMRGRSRGRGRGHRAEVQEAMVREGPQEGPPV